MIKIRGSPKIPEARDFGVEIPERDTKAIVLLILAEISTDKY